jgi:hypothetical protein
MGPFSVEITEKHICQYLTPEGLPPAADKLPFHPLIMRVLFSICYPVHHFLVGVKELVQDYRAK